MSESCDQIKYRSCGDMTLFDCHYKNWQRKEQEYEKLKAENEELKEIIQRHDNDNNALLKEVEDELCEYYRRHRECLTEIKEIVQFGFRPYKVCGEHNNCCDVLNEIWNKISECEVVE